MKNERQSKQDLVGRIANERAAIENAKSKKTWHKPVLSELKTSQTAGNSGADGGRGRGS